MANTQVRPDKVNPLAAFDNYFYEKDKKN